MTSPSESEFWRVYDAVEARLTAPLSERMLDLGGVQPGMRVLDLATGRGEPAVRAALRVQPGGLVIGVDRSVAMLRFARDRASREGATHLALAVMDCTSLSALRDSWADCILCRFGLMYFQDPVAALAEARRTLKPGGRLILAVWTDEDRASFITLPRRVRDGFVAQVAPRPPGPGTFHYADPARLATDLARTGFRLDHAESFETAVVETATAAELADWAWAFGEARALSPLGPEIAARWRKAFIEAARPRQIGGNFRLGGITRVVACSATSTP